MRRSRTIALCVVLLIGGGSIWYKLAYPTYVYRFRLAIAVEVGGATKTASSVIEVRTITQPGQPMFSPIRREVYGDAVFLDLGNVGNIVVLLGCNPDGTEDCVGTLIPQAFGVEGGLKNLFRLETLSGSRELTGKLMPTMIHFSHLDDPKSARVVDPDEFEKVFGPDVHFKRIWVEITTDAVTRDIEKKLPWWSRSGRPAEEAYRAWLEGKTIGPSIGPETRFTRSF